MKITKLVFTCLLFLSIQAIAQEAVGPSSVGTIDGPILVPSIADQIRNGTVIYADNTPVEGHPKLRHGNRIVPGKGLPKGNDPLLGIQEQAEQRQTRAPDLIFTADISQATPSDPTGAAGPNHYLGAWNTAYRIFDKSGNPLTAELSLGTLFPGNAIGDPIVFYDANVDNGAGQPRGRFVVTEFDSNPNGFNVAVSAGPDPVNDPWNVYTMNLGTGNFPDYTKFAIWGDAYVVTANINPGGAAMGNRVFAVDREAMIAGDPNGSVAFVAFPLPGIATNGFYSPHAFHTTADEAVPPGTPAPIIYMQDDAWAGVPTGMDHLQIWEATIDFDTPANSSIVTAQELAANDNNPDELISPFVSVFDGGSFSNRPQGGGGDIDILQATVMNQVQYRRFGTHNSVVLNFVIDAIAGGGELAAIRWYELRQTADGMPWTVFQEGTYTAPDGRDAYSGSMVMNSQGDIAMAYTSSSATDRISIRYTGRFDGDPPGVMTALEQTIATSNAANPSNRLADYVHLTNDPADDSFWHIAEHFEPSRRDVVANFTLQAPEPDDIGVASIDSPTSGKLTASETIEITITNFGSNDITDPMVQYTIDGGAAITEQFSGILAAGTSASFSFSQTVDLSDLGAFVIAASTLLEGDSNPENDEASVTVTNSPDLPDACIPDSDCTFPDGVTVIDIADQDIISECTEPGGYTDQTDIIFTFDPDDNTVDGIIQLAFANSNFALFIDFDDSGVFETNELVGEGLAGGANTDFPITLDFTDFTIEERIGSHRFRVRGADQNNGAGDVTDPCGDLVFGRTNDFTAFFDESLSVGDTVFDDSQFTIVEHQENVFDISLRTPFDGNAAISVFNLIGQQVVFNNLDKEGDAFNYQLDMSFAKTGIYIIQFGDVNGGATVTRKIVVK